MLDEQGFHNIIIWTSTCTVKNNKISRSFLFLFCVCLKSSISPNLSPDKVGEIMFTLKDGYFFIRNSFHWNVFLMCFTLDVFVNFYFLFFNFFIQQTPSPDIFQLEMFVECLIWIDITSFAIRKHAISSDWQTILDEAVSIYQSLT